MGSRTSAEGPWTHTEDTGTRVKGSGIAVEGHGSLDLYRGPQDPYKGHGIHTECLRDTSMIPGHISRVPGTLAEGPVTQAEGLRPILRASGPQNEGTGTHTGGTGPISRAPRLLPRAQGPDRLRRALGRIDGPGTHTEGFETQAKVPGASETPTRAPGPTFPLK